MSEKESPADNITPITEAAEKQSGKRPGPKAKADVIYDARSSLRQAAGAVVEGCINDIAKIVPGRPGADWALWWLAGQIRVAVNMADNASGIIAE